LVLKICTRSNKNTLSSSDGKRPVPAGPLPRHEARPLLAAEAARHIHVPPAGRLLDLAAPVHDGDVGRPEPAAGHDLRPRVTFSGCHGVRQPAGEREVDGDGASGWVGGRGEEESTR